jgi:hypothetical protein
MIAEGLTVPERVLLFCIESATDWQKAGITHATAKRISCRSGCCAMSRGAGGLLGIELMSNADTLRAAARGFVARERIPMAPT